MKIFKKLATLALALTLCAGIGAFAACDNTSGSGNSSSSSSNVETGAYKFKILNKDGSAAVGYSVQLCILNDAGEQTACYAPAVVDEKGQVSYSADTVPGFPGAGNYNIHVLDSNNQQVEFEGLEKTPTAYNTEDIVLTLK